MDVVVAGSQKGLMLPPGLSFNAISEKAWAACQAGGDRRSYWDWRDMMTLNDAGYFPYPSATPLLFGLREAFDMFAGDGLEPVFATHQRHASGTRPPADSWGGGILALRPDHGPTHHTHLRNPHALWRLR